MAIIIIRCLSIFAFCLYWGSKVEENRFKYFENWKTEVLTCPKCGWKGTFEEGDREYYSTLMDSSCPKCDWNSSPVLAIVRYPSMQETEENWDKLSDDDKQELLAKKIVSKMGKSKYSLKF